MLKKRQLAPIDAVGIACRDNQLEKLVEWKAAGLLPDLMQRSPKCTAHRPHELAALNGNLEVLKWLVNDSGQHIDLTSADMRALRAAAENRQLAVVKWLVRDSCQLADVTVHDSYCLRIAAQNGDIELVRWLLEDSQAATAQNPAWANTSIPSLDIFADDTASFRLAAENGHLAVIKLLFEKSNRQISIDAAHNYALRYAAQNGHLAVLQWLVEESGQLVDLTCDDNYVCRHATRFDHFNIVDWALHDSGQVVGIINCSLDPWYERLPTRLQSTIDRARVVLKFLRTAPGSPENDLSVYAVSMRCYLAINAGLVQTIDDLDIVLNASATTVGRRKL